MPGRDHVQKKKKDRGLDLFESDYLIHFLLFSKTLKEMQRQRARAAGQEKKIRESGGWLWLTSNMRPPLLEYSTGRLLFAQTDQGEPDINVNPKQTWPRYSRRN